jgi:hypothetical protein
MKAEESLKKLKEKLNEGRINRRRSHKKLGRKLE